MRDLTGAPSYFYDIGKIDVWSEIEASLEKGLMICCNTKSEVPQEDMGIVSDHCYGLLRSEELDPDIRILQLRNPHGIDKWKGDWSDQSAKWTKEYKDHVQLEQNDYDGIFWISLSDFIQNFETIEICKINEKSNFTHFYIEDKFTDFSLFSVEFGEKGFHTISVSLKDKRCFNSKFEFKYSLARIYISK